MGFNTTIDLGPVAHGLSLPLASVETVVRLLDAGNTVPFITRYRKDQTGGLDEEQIRDIEARVAKLRLLAERKQTILRSIESQGKLTPELAKAIESADSTKRLEDLYLPYKPKKQTLATLARERQLEPLAAEVLSGSSAALDLDARARDFVNPDKQVHTPADALLGVGHILAEDFSERADLRDRLRKILRRTGKLICTRIESNGKDNKKQEVTPEAAAPQTTPLAGSGPAPESARDALVPITSEMGSVAGDVAQSSQPGDDAPALAMHDDMSQSHATEAEEYAAAPHTTPLAQSLSEEVPASETSAPEDETLRSSEPPAEAPIAPSAAESAESVEAPLPGGPPSAAGKPISRKEAARREREAKKARKENWLTHEFRDYFNYQEQLSKIPPHRVLAINRGERAKILRIRIDSDTAEMTRIAEQMLVHDDQPHAEFLRGCVRDALARLVIPSLEREVRRELTENAESHAVEVFAKNLRNLLLQPPVRGRRVMALDPGFKSGCKTAVLDEFGNLLDHAVVHLVGKPERKQEARSKIVELIRQHSVTVLAIGNGTACRETEEFVAEIIANEFKDDGVAYVIVNEAGASVYSTSPIGREELPQYDATLRGAISIGRRLQDPLSELVKIDPANIGVGLYQHDVKAKHLRTSLDAVVESCVNYVGVDLNTASPALLRYVSGLNQLTARRLYDFRTTAGPFKRRDQLKDVPGFGEATFVQAAGFLKITDGDQPLDTTWIHPESYETAHKVLERLNRSEADLAKKETPAELAEQAKSLDLNALAEELHVGQLTLGDILSQFARPGRDPREDLPEPIFKRGILKLDDLQPGMELSGSVLNVVDFGAFVDIGLHDSGLVHVSQLANRYVRDPHEVISVGDVVKVWVLEIDKTRRRVSLTMIPPGTKKAEPFYRRGKPDRRAPGTAGPAEQARPAAAPGDPAAGAPQPRPPRSDRRERRPDGRTPRPQPAEGSPQGPPGPQRGNRRGGQPAHLRSYGGRQGGGRPGGGGGSGRGAPYQHRPKSPPKPLPPITKKMIEGKEPMRTFGDLLQFMKVKDEPEATAPPPSQPSPSEPAAETAKSPADIAAASQSAPERAIDESMPTPSGAVPPPHPAARNEPISQPAAPAEAGGTPEP